MRVLLHMMHSPTICQMRTVHYNSTVGSTELLRRRGGEEEYKRRSADDSHLYPSHSIVPEHNVHGPRPLRCPELRPSALPASARLAPCPLLAPTPL